MKWICQYQHINQYQMKMPLNEWNLHEWNIFLALAFQNLCKRVISLNLVCVASIIKTCTCVMGWLFCEQTLQHVGLNIAAILTTILLRLFINFTAVLHITPFWFGSLANKNSLVARMLCLFYALTIFLVELSAVVKLLPHLSPVRV